MSFDSRTFRKALGCFPTGVTVVTTVDGESLPIGVTVSSFTSLSLTPPLVLFCLDNQNTSLDAFKAGGRLAVNVLSDQQRELSIRFASRLEDKWKDLAYDKGTGGVPLLRGCLATFECTAVDVRDGGDHQIVIGRVEELFFNETGQPLLYYRGSYAEVADGEG